MVSQNLEVARVAIRKRGVHEPVVQFRSTNFSNGVFACAVRHSGIYADSFRC